MKEFEVTPPLTITERMELCERDNYYVGLGIGLAMGIIVGAWVVLLGARYFL